MWKKEMEVGRHAAREAGKILTSLFGRVKEIKKKGEIDLVTEADIRAERKILEVLTEHFPQDSILTEESGEHRHRPDRVWLIDPLDGTTNFAHALPFFAVSIALEVEKELVLGIIYNPHMDVLFGAVKGDGAFRNGSPIRVSKTTKLGDALLVTGFPYDVRENPDGITLRFKKMLTLAQGVRRLGSAALDLAYVAAGIFDGYWEERLHPWDMAAGAVLVREAGGRVSDYKGNPFSPYGKTIIASNGQVHEDILSALEESRIT
ncbi:MAG: inositol monophosphatase [Desulfobacterales bacterium]|nr:inositol monophosphatase [Desulfobacterales bacterium]